MPARNSRWLTLVVATILGCTLPHEVSAQAVLLVHTGANFSRLTPHQFDPAEYSHVRGLVVGMGVSAPLYRPLALRAEVQYMEKGTRLGGFSRIDLTYVEVPILLEYSPTIDRRLRPLVTLGIAAGRELACTGRTPSDLGGWPTALDCDDFRSATTDMALIAGVGLQVAIGDIDLTGELRHARGSQDLTGYHNHNRTTSVIVGLRTR